MSEKPVILLIDDDSLLVDTIRMYLEDSYKIVGFSGEKCFDKTVDFIEKTKEVPALAIIDLALSNGKNGVELANYIHLRSGLKNIIFFTGCHEVDPLVKEARGSNFDIVEKPIKYSELKRVVDDKLA